MAETSGDMAYFHVVRCVFGAPELLGKWTQWYETVHIPAILAVPGMRSVTRYAEIGSDNSFLAVWEIDSPAVFDHPAYAEARGWGPWEPYIREWSISLLEQHRPERRSKPPARETER